MPVLNKQAPRISLDSRGFLFKSGGYLHPSVAVGVTAPLIGHGWPKGNPLKALFSHGCAVPSAQAGLTSLFGMGRGRREAAIDNCR